VEPCAITAWCSCVAAGDPCWDLSCIYSCTEPMPLSLSRLRTVSHSQLDVFGGCIPWVTFHAASILFPPCGSRSNDKVTLAQPLVNSVVGSESFPAMLPAEQSPRLPASATGIQSLAHFGEKRNVCIHIDILRPRGKFVWNKLVTRESPSTGSYRRAVWAASDGNSDVAKSDQLLIRLNFKMLMKEC